MNVKIVCIVGGGRNILNRMIDIGCDLGINTAPGILATTFDNTDKLVAENATHRIRPK